VRKTWLVATTTYRRRIRSGMFLILTFGLPVLMVIAGGIAVLSELSGNLGTVGYVDQTGQLQPVSEVQFEGQVLQLTSFPDVAAARQGVQRSAKDPHSSSASLCPRPLRSCLVSLS
jgi:ABC-type Na+ efflux pump permease subunit